MRFVFIILLSCFLNVIPVSMGIAQEQVTKDLELLDFANGLFQRDFFDMAIEGYNKVISQYPDSQYLADAYFGISESQFFLKQYDVSIEHYTKFFQNYPEDPKVNIAYLRVGQSYLLLDQFEQALDFLERVQLDALNTDLQQTLLYYKGKVLRTQGLMDGAIRLFTKAIENDAEGKFTPHAYVEIGDLFSEEEAYQDALANYDLAYKKAQDDETQSLALHKMGEMQFLTGKHELSVYTFRSVIEKFAKEEIAQDSYANLLTALYNTNQYNDVIEEYAKRTEFLKKDGHYFNATYITAAAYQQVVRYAEAIALLDELLAQKDLLDEQHKKALLKKVDILVKDSQYIAVVDLIESQSEGLLKNSDQAVFLKAEAYYGLGNHYKAYEWYSLIRKQFSDSKYNVPALYGMAHALNEQGKREEAAELFNQYFSEAKDEEKRQEAIYNAILIYVKINQVKKAIAACDAYLGAFEKGSRKEKILFLAATLYPKIDQYQKAIDLLILFLDYYPDSARAQEVNFLLGYNYQMLNDYDKAIAIYGNVTVDAGEEIYYSSLENKVYILLQKGEEDSAAEILNQIIVEYASNELKLKNYLWLSEYYFKKEKFEDIVRILQNVDVENASDDNKAGIAYFKAEAYFKLQQWAEAVINYNIVIESLNNEVFLAPSRIGKGISLVNQQSYIVAKKEFNTAIDENLDDATITMRARFELGNVERLEGNLEGSVKFYMLVAVLYQDQDYCSRALFLAGEVFEELGKFKEAISVYQELLRDYPDSEYIKDEIIERLEALSAQ